MVEIFQHTDQLLYVLSGLLLGGYYAYYLWPIRRSIKPEVTIPSATPLSLIIAYKNEEHNLKAHLPLWLAQDHHDFEIVLVNDHSDDRGPEFLAKQPDQRLKLIELENDHGKKAAIQLGISKASNSCLLFTDADCKPLSRKWFEKMTAPLANGKGIVVGYSGFYAKSTLLNAIQRYENCTNTLQNEALIAKGRAYMAVGRNLAYRKELLRKPLAPESNAILSGDDDLLVNQLSRNGNTVFVGGPAAHTISSAASSWSTYFFQRRRQLEAGKFYKRSDRLKLGALGTAQLVFNLLFIKLLFDNDFQSYILAIFVLKVSLQCLVYFGPLKRLGEIQLCWLSPLLEIIYLPIISFVGISQYLYKVDRWK